MQVTATYGDELGRVHRFTAGRAVAIAFEPRFPAVTAAYIAALCALRLADILLIADGAFEGVLVVVVQINVQVRVVFVLLLFGLRLRVFVLFHLLHHERQSVTIGLAVIQKRN